MEMQYRVKFPQWICVFNLTVTIVFTYQWVILQVLKEESLSNNWNFISIYVCEDYFMEIFLEHLLKRKWNWNENCKSASFTIPQTRNHVKYQYCILYFLLLAYLSQKKKKKKKKLFQSNLLNFLFHLHGFHFSNLLAWKFQLA